MRSMFLSQTDNASNINPNCIKISNKNIPCIQDLGKQTIGYEIYHKNKKYKALVQHKTITGPQLVYENDIYFLYYCWVRTSHCSHNRSSCAHIQARHFTPALATRTALQLTNSSFTWLCCELTCITLVITRPTAVTCFAHLPTERPVRWPHRIKGEAFPAHKHCAACQIPGRISQWPRAVVERMEDCHQCLEEYGYVLRRGW